jgi:hypothetical protein
MLHAQELFSKGVTKMKTNHIISLITLLTLAACGNSGSGGESAANNGPQHESVEASQGTYYTVLRPVNFYSNGFIPYGAATFSIKEDSLQVNVTMDDDQAVVHRQALHSGSRCPTIADDSNGDSFIDYQEALAVVGEAIMPLDADLNSRDAGSEVYPRGPAMTYSRSASLSSINADLNQASRGNIGLEGRVVLVHGTSPNSSFPSSLAAHNGEAPHLSLPVVCGVLKKID